MDSLYEKDRILVIEQISRHNQWQMLECMQCIQIS
jgi:hypothetical protein